MDRSSIVHRHHRVGQIANPHHPILPERATRQRQSRPVTGSPYHWPMPTTTPGARGTDPFEQARLAARELTRHTGVDHHDVLVVLGTGLSSVAHLLGADGSPIDLTTLPWFPRFTAIGHRPEVWSLELGSSRALVVAGRLHLYEGRTPAEVVHPVRTAMATGCHTVVLTCSAGAVDPTLTSARWWPSPTT